ncbi:M23 family metallopeptidase [Flaviaesturariibacter amylovorans]|uniref:M23ase beta-sheet core domain-containing protein n=1 Tax=Flaviaesturariibacter amylovorans TaxID=1084520 RepID=A0ABP8G9A1_9BACT
MKTVLPLLLGAALVSCGPARSVFKKDTPREAYERRLDKADIDETPEGRAWRAAGASALAAPVGITLPYRHSGRFGTDKPRALGLRFTAKQGQSLRIAISERDATTLPLYAEVFREDGGTTALQLSAEPGAESLRFDVEHSGTYILRLQPALRQGGTYSLSVGTGPTLGFPVAGPKAKAGSFWGADRDGGARRHEGVDIFAPKGTPAVAGAAGTVTSVSESPLGGKYVFLRPDGKNYNLYYAHLDEQLVRPGQRVAAGETIGLVGNTGNARTTPAHLHFGIYTYEGAVDPYPFIDKTERQAPALAKRSLPLALKLRKTQRTESGTTVPAQSVLPALALTDKGYLAELPGGGITLLPFATVQPV